MLSDEVMLSCSSQLINDVIESDLEGSPVLNKQVIHFNLPAPWSSSESSPSTCNKTPPSGVPKVKFNLPPPWSSSESSTSSTGNNSVSPTDCLPSKVHFPPPDSLSAQTGSYSA